jgi:ribonuclease J
MYIGESAARVLREANFFGPSGIALQPHGFLADRRRFSAEPFELTPYLVDHSAFGAYALHVAAAGSLFYSGDLRAHGRKASLFERLIKRTAAVDALLLEGTRIDERDGDERGLAERARSRGAGACRLPTRPRGRARLLLATAFFLWAGQGSNLRPWD